MAFVADPRTPAEIVAELARIAARTPLPSSLDAVPAADPQHPPTWADALFRRGDLADRTEPSQTLLAALAALHGRRLLAHFDTLPADARRWFAQARLGIQPLPPQADTVVLVVDADPKRAPEVLPKGAAVQAGKDAFGGERVYVTQEALTVLGIAVVGAKTRHVPASGPDRVAEIAPVDPAPAPFPALGADDAGAVAVHRLYLASPLLELGSGTYTIALTFAGITFSTGAVTSATAVQGILASLRWSLAGPKGSWIDLGQATASGGPQSVTLKFTVTDPWSEARPIGGGAAVHHLVAEFDEASATFPRAQALGLSFGNVSVAITASGVRPDNGFFNDGVVDVSKEFKPFGPVPREGDSFGLRSDSAFSKPLSHLTLVLHDRHDFEQGSSAGTKVLVYEKKQIGKVGTGKYGTTKEPSAGGPAVELQRYRNGVWQKLGTTVFADENMLFDENVAVLDPFSEQASLGGAVGHSLRIVLRGDFGWTDYEQLLADNVSHMLKQEPSLVKPATPPKPPRVGSVTIGYSTEARTLKANPDDVALYAENGPSAPIPLLPGAAQQVTPFQLDPSGRPGALYVGFARAPEGEVVALYLEIDEQSACDVTQAEAEVDWRYLSTGGTWQPLVVVDRTAQLRQSGIVRFAVPEDWQLGSPDVGEAAGYWLQASSEQPSLAGRLRRLRTDAVEAVYRFGSDRSRDVTPETPLPPGTAKQLKVAVPGIKKVQNPGESWGGRGPEPAAAFARRTSRVLRHRNRAVTAWDVEALVTESFPDVGLVRCLPHHSHDSECAAGWLAAVLVPRSLERLPRPTVRLAGLVEEFLHEHATGGLRVGDASHVAILCPKYAEALVVAKVKLVRGVQGGEARRQIEADLSEWLRPLGPNPERSEFGRSLFLSSVVWWLESRPEVAYVESCAFGGDFAGLDRIDVDGCRGLVASAAAHDLQVVPQL